MKKALKITGIVVLVLIVLLAASPYLFEGKIKSLIKENVNKNINAKFDFVDADLSLLRSFPQATVTLDGMLSLIHI